jgi:hypothetical protein
LFLAANYETISSFKIYPAFFSIFVPLASN